MINWKTIKGVHYFGNVPIKNKDLKGDKTPLSEYINNLKKK